MNQSGPTHYSLIARIRDTRDDQAWSDFLCVYSPLIYDFLRRRGLQPADAADVAQDVMRTVLRSVDRFEPTQRLGAFRKWLLSIIRSRYCDYLRRHDPLAAGTGDTHTIGQLSQQPMPDEEREHEELEYRRHVLCWATDRVRSEVQPKSWQAFQMTYVDGISCSETAKHLEISIEAVYMSRSRILSRLREKIREFEL